MEKQIHFSNHLGERLAGTLHLPEPQKGTNGRGVVMGHCFTCSRHTGILRQLGRDLAAAGYVALRFDFSGNGQSEGLFSDSTYTKQIAEMNTAADRIGREGATWIGMAGHSMGAVIAVLTAGQSERVKAVCAMAGRLSGLDARRFLNPGQIDEIEKTGRVTFTSRGRSLEMTGQFFSDADRFDLPGILRSFPAPLLVLHGDNDTVVPVSEAHGAESLNPGRIEMAIIPGADHMFGSDDHRRHISRRVTEWFGMQM